ncbi:MAG: twin-arginine translocase subunit TatC [Candidatus Hodarchaeales archaeon]
MNKSQDQKVIAGMPTEELAVHIIELIRRLKVIFLSLVLTTLVVSLLPAKFLEGEFVFDDYSPSITVVLKIFLVWATSLAEDQGGTFQFTLGAPYSVILVCIELAIIIAVILNIPVISYEIYIYIRPALYDEEANFARNLSISFGILFSLGVIAGMILVPLMVQTLFGLTTIIDFGENRGLIVNFVPLESFVEFIFLSLIGTGLLFTYPIWIVFASLAGLVTSENLMERRREILIALIAITAIITPDPTPISMILLSLPLIALYEAAIVVVMRLEEKISSGDRFSATKRITDAWEDLGLY